MPARFPVCRGGQVQWAAAGGGCCDGEKAAGRGLAGEEGGVGRKDARKTMRSRVMTVLRYRGPLCKIPFAIFLNVSTLYVYTYRPCLREVLPPKSEQDEDNPHLHG